MKKPIDYKDIAVHVISFLFIVLFVFTAMSKLIHFGIFQNGLNQAPMLEEIANSVAVGIPAAALLVVALLAFNRTRLWGLVGALLLMLLFTGYIAWALSFSPTLPCTCNGLFNLDWKQHLWFNAGFLLLAAIGVALQNKKDKRNIDQIEAPDDEILILISIIKTK